jgi:hypothetical protein
MTWAIVNQVESELRYLGCLTVCVYIYVYIYINKVSSGRFYDTNQKNMGSPILLQCDMPALDLKKKMFCSVPHEN